MPALLTRHNLTRTCDLDEARARIADVFCPHRLELTRPDSRLDTVHNGYQDGAVGLNYLRYGSEVRIVPGAMESFYLVQIPLVGRAQVRIGSERVQSDRRTATIASPTLFTDMTWSDDCEQLLVYLSRTAVQDYARDVLGDTSGRSVRFAPSFDLTAPAAQSWLRLVNWLREDVEGGGVMSQTPVIAAQFEAMVIGGLFDIQTNSVTRPRHRPQPVAPRSVAMVRDAIEADPARAWTVTDLARVAHVSVRSLQESFARDLQTTPTQYLRRVRLERARAEMSMADRSTTTVSEIAIACGFAHFGRFSTLYRATYGESPSQTLARS
ncbi:AraC family transcriptional regulator [Williamsia sp. CHRR-6]|uniref:AraC family transcriptional regulator n=1 Tax=Williamsia sp. CHRR-6 TaxID=2835871 RepID=UPI001BDAE7D8|nr:AraC family transcriptional regulator [Williamsia sp. CHRR-6]MBT0567562.1 AraC family transcriptional regulator [Williamsia sp. CHRR-6]